jgi:hypothetical protein
MLAQGKQGTAANRLALPSVHFPLLCGATLRYTISTAARVLLCAVLLCERRRQRTLRLPQRPRQPAGQIAALVNRPQVSHWRAAHILVVHKHLPHASMPYAVYAFTVLATGQMHACVHIAQVYLHGGNSFACRDALAQIRSCQHFYENAQLVAGQQGLCSDTCIASLKSVKASGYAFMASGARSRRAHAAQPQATRCAPK